MNQFSSLPESADRYAPDGAYAFTRLALSLLIATLIGVGMWAVIVVLPQAQLEFGVDRSAASLPYTLMMCTLAFATIALGRMTDRFGIVLPMAISAVTLGVGFVLAGYAPNLFVFTAAHVLIGVGAGTGFGPMMADISHWFVKRRGLAVVVVASGNYFAGTIWPLLMSLTMPLIGWRATYAGIGLIVAARVLPLALLMRRRPSAAVYDQAEAATEAARADVGISPRLLLVLLFAAGFSCCVAMSMPQVHLVAYCGDLGYGVARGAQMLSLMMLLGIVSRIGSGFVADAIGGAATLMIGSFMQGVALLLYLYFNGLSPSSSSPGSSACFRAASCRCMRSSAASFCRLAGQARRSALSSRRPSSAWRSAAISPESSSISPAPTAWRF